MEYVIMKEKNKHDCLNAAATHTEQTAACVY